MEMQRRESGLVVPAKKPSKPERRYGPLELCDPSDREQTREALLSLWDAMGLSHPGGMVLPSGESYEAHWALYHFVGKMLLGDDCPEKEVWT